MDDIFNSQTFKEFLQKKINEITEDQKNNITCQEILKLEKELVEFAPQNIVQIYFQIDFLTHMEHEYFKSSLLKLR
jgi:hypothetical protein